MSPDTVGTSDTLLLSLGLRTDNRSGRGPSLCPSTAQRAPNRHPKLRARATEA